MRTQAQQAIIADSDQATHLLPCFGYATAGDSGWVQELRELLPSADVSLLLTGGCSTA